MWVSRIFGTSLPWNTIWKAMGILGVRTIWYSEVWNGICFTVLDLLSDCHSQYSRFLRYLAKFPSRTFTPSKFRCVLSQQTWSKKFIFPLSMKVKPVDAHICLRRWFKSFICHFRLFIGVKPEIAMFSTPFSFKSAPNEAMFWTMSSPWMFWNRSLLPAWMMAVL